MVTKELALKPSACLVHEKMHTEPSFEGEGRDGFDHRTFFRCEKQRFDTLANFFFINSGFFDELIQENGCVFAML